MKKVHSDGGLMLCAVIFQNILGISSIDVRDISYRLDEAFFGRNLTLEESEVIFANARESYAILKDFQMRGIHGGQLMNKLKIFTSRIIRDVEDENLNVTDIFDNMCSNLKGDTSSWILEEDAEVLKLKVEIVLEIINRKLKDHHAVFGRVRPDVERILSLKEINMEKILLKQTRIDASSIAFFFLEVFATLLGLSWGIISMAIGKPV